MIVYDPAKQVQTLAIETRFTPSAPPDSQTASFAWVIPLPGPDAPSIRPATTGLFPTLRAIFQPRVVDAGRGFAQILLPLALLVLLLLAVTVNWRQLAWGQKVLLGLIAIPMCLFLCLLILPSLGGAGSRAGGSEPLVTVLRRSIIGAYDIAVIGADDSAAAPPLDAGRQLAAWLKDNGFQMPTGVEPVLAQYAAKKWVFAACRLRGDSAPGSESLTPHPLIFTFKTPQCVYPLALTGVGNGPLSVDLYVFSDQRAAAPGFTEIRCQELGLYHAGETDVRRGHDGRVRLAHTLIRELASGSTVATKLSATLTPAQQAADAQLAWLPPRELGGKKYSPRGASSEAFDLASAVFLAGLLVLIVVCALRKQAGSWVFKKLWLPLAIALLAGSAVYVVLPKVEVVPGGYRASLRRHAYHDRAYLEAINLLREGAPVMLEQRRLRGEPAQLSIDDAKRAVVSAWEQEKKHLDALPKLEDSPLNYTIEPGSSEGSYDYVWYDADGAPTRVPLWPPPSAGSEQRRKY